MPATPSARFPTTAWNCIEAARDPLHPSFQTAITRLVSTYWRPVFHFLRARGYATADAEDLTQECFARCLQPGSPLHRADRGQRRFRDFLRTSVKRFAYEQIVRPRKQAAFERGLVSIHDLMCDSDRAYEPPAGETPEDAFDRAWKTGLLQSVRDNLEAHYVALSDAQERQRFEIFAALNFVERDEDRPTLDELAEHFGLTRDRVRYAIDQVRKRSERLLRQEIRDQVGPDVDVEQEMRKLL